MSLGSGGLQANCQNKIVMICWAVVDQCQVSGTCKCAEKVGNHTGLGDHEELQGPGRNLLLSAWIPEQDGAG